MCQFENGFKLCTCKNLSNSSDSSNELDKDVYVWKLSSITEIELIMGRYLPPEDIGQGLEVEWILLNLNIENCFDFDYQPQEDDHLIFYLKPQKINNHNRHLCGGISFIYTDGQWREHIDFGGDKKTQIATGLIEKHQR